MFSWPRDMEEIIFKITYNSHHNRPPLTSLSGRVSGHLLSVTRPLGVIPHLPETLVSSQNKATTCHFHSRRVINKARALRLSHADPQNNRRRQFNLRVLLLARVVNFAWPSPMEAHCCSSVPWIKIGGKPFAMPWFTNKQCSPARTF